MSYIQELVDISYTKSLRGTGGTLEFQFYTTCGHEILASVDIRKGASTDEITKSLYSLASTIYKLHYAKLEDCPICNEALEKITRLREEEKKEEIAHSCE